MALIVTPGAVDANSYATVVEFRAYWGTRLFNSVPIGLTDPQVESVLMWACRLVDVSFSWTGAAVDSVQDLCWPRSGMLTRNGFPVATTVIPQDLKNAQCQLAGDLAIGDRTVDNDAQKQGITSLRAGPVSLSFADISKLTDLAQMDAAIRRMGPEFAWVSAAISDAARSLLVPSWYVRATLLRTITFDVHR